MPFRLLAIADPHHTTNPRRAHPHRHGVFGAEFIQRSIVAARRGGHLDAIALLGDMVDDADTPEAPEELAHVAATIAKAAPGIPVLAVPGNHDRALAPWFADFGWLGGPQTLGGYRFFAFSDPYGNGDTCTRQSDDRATFGAFADAGDAPLIVLQHCPLMPTIDDPYPYHHTNRADILADYTRHGVLLSLSGHYHAAAPLTRYAGVDYLPVPSLCEKPFRYNILRLEGRSVTVEEGALALPAAAGIVDCHAHTEFAYCGRGITADDAIARARLFGLRGIDLVEHAPQLYVAADDFWAGRHVRVPGLWRHNPAARMEAFLERMRPKRDSFTRIGLEVEVDAGGALILNDADRARVDLLVGAVHFLPEDPRKMTDAEFDIAFIRAHEQLLAHRLDILAHPTRMYAVRGRPVPQAVRTALLDLLCATHTAAEINFHVQPPEVEFLRQCVARGIALTTGSDAHVPEEMADFHQHIALLAALHP